MMIGVSVTCQMIIAQMLPMPCEKTRRGWGWGEIRSPSHNFIYPILFAALFHVLCGFPATLLGSSVRC
jgi:hypothetical protein